MDLRSYIPPFLVESSQSADYHQTVTRKRMERFSSSGQLLSVTDVKTTNFDPPRVDVRRQRAPSWNPESRSERHVREEYRIPRPIIERNHPIRRVEDEKDSLPQSTWKTSDSFVRKSSILKTSSSRDGSEWSRSYNSPKVEWREPLDCLIDRLNRLRMAAGCETLEPSIRLADISTRWARMLALRGEFRSDPSRYMNIWMGSRVNDTIADTWWDEAEEFGTANYLADRHLEWVGVASAYSDSHQQFIVVATFE
ncbi:unnamed protein product [Caenorhabditis auriculariae]|uniref:SCP domain-containing protein n=1 Tax=Caenorhabditis auriculariae TaxID=2777116 RepID=A0A8S1GVE7_9PELO|nr:unnamed protein product [Caenorhabditis auriculariae]